MDEPLRQARPRRWASLQHLAALEETRQAAQDAYPWMADDIRIVSLVQLLARVDHLPAGDYAEMGVLHGYTARCIWRLRQPGTKLYLFDTFAGFAREDIDLEKQWFGESQWDGVTFDSISADAVVDRITDGFGPHDDLVVREGRVPDTLAGLDLSLRFAHLDLDVGPPTLSALQWLWPRLVPGGFILTHDYGIAAGIRLAVDEFCRRYGLAWVPLPDLYGSAVIAKSQ